MIIVNLRGNEDGDGADRLLADLDRLRKDKQVFDDVLGWRGKKTPVTADLSNVKDAGTKKAVARIRRNMKVRS